MCGAIGNFFCVQTLACTLHAVQTKRKHLSKILIFFFHMIFWGYAKPSFGWYKVTSRSFVAATPTIRLPGAPKLGTKLIFVSSLGRHTDWVGASIRCNSKIHYKPVKNAKKR